MRTLLTVIVTAIVTVAIFLWISVFKPEWLVRLKYDKFGFPRIKKRGDRFVLEGQNYTYDGDKWVKVDANWFPLNPVEGDSFVVDGVGYKFTGGVWVKITNPGDPSEERNLVGLASISVVNGQFGQFEGGVFLPSGNVRNGTFVPFLTISQIDAMNAGDSRAPKGAKCVCTKSTTTNAVTGKTVTSETCTYGGHVVSKKSCQEHGKY